MPAISTHRQSRPVLWRAGFLSLNYLLLWCRFYVALILFVLVEGRVLQGFGVTFIPEDSVQLVQVAKFSVSLDGRTAVSQMGFRRDQQGAGIVNDVVLHDLVRRTAQRLQVGEHEPSLVAISPAADLLAFACQDGSVFVATPAQGGDVGREPTTALRQLLPQGDQPVRLLEFSPNSHWLVVMAKQHARVLHVPADMLRRTPAATGQLSREVLQSIQRAKPAAANPDPAGPEDALRIPMVDGLSTSFAFTADSCNLVTLDDQGHVDWWNIVTGQRVVHRQLAVTSAVCTALAAGGEWAATIEPDGVLRCWDLSRSHKHWQHAQPRLLWRHPQPGALAFSPDGRLLVTVCRLDLRYAIYCYDTESGDCTRGWPRYASNFKGLVVISRDQFISWDSEPQVKAWNVPAALPVSRFAWQLN